MSTYVGCCQRCGKPFQAKPRVKLALMREISPGNFSTGGWSHYYCEECARKITNFLNNERGGRNGS